MAAGNWIPELVELAGGHPLVEVPGQHAPTMAWEAFVATDPDIIVLMPCGFDLDRAREATEQLAQRSEWEQLQAVRNNRVYLTDGNQYFNRPGPRLVDSLEILAEIIHPDLFDFDYRGTGWEPMSS
jgi:iron complex transport system substrate-binding protein